MKSSLLFLVVLVVVVNLEAKPVSISSKQENKQVQKIGAFIDAITGKFKKSKATAAPVQEATASTLELTTVAEEEELPIDSSEGESNKGGSSSVLGEANQAQGKEQKAVVVSKGTMVAISQKDGQSQSAKGVSKSKNLKGAKAGKQEQTQSQSIDVVAK